MPRSLSRLFCRVRSSQSPASRPRPLRRPLRCELLEDRRLLSVVPYVVDSLADVVALDGKITLREALQAANTNTAVCDAHAGSATETDIIRFAEGLSGTIGLSGTQLEISGDVEIQGPGAEALAIDGGGQSRVFISHAPFHTAISGLTITGGTDEDGGGIVNEGTLTLSDSILSHNTASGSHGRGGGICNWGALTLSNSTLSGNSAGDSGGGIWNCLTVSVTGSLFSENSAGGGGGGIWNKGTLTIGSSVLSGNAAHSAGGIWNKGTATAIVTDVSFLRNVATSAGAIRNETDAVFTLDHCTISGNSASYGGAGIVNGSTAMTIINSVLSGNSTTGDGGAIGNWGDLTLINSTLAGNSAGSGGGIFMENPDHGSLTIVNCIVALNEAAETPNVRAMVVAPSGFNLIGGDPGFVRDPSPGPDGAWGTADDDFGDLRLTDTSPAIDMGSSDAVPPGLTTDIEGSPRIAGTQVDIGAYEFQGSPAAGREAPSVVVTTLGDTVDLYDGAVSLREALLYAEQPDADHTITFAAPLDGGEIVLGETLYVSGPVRVDASALGAININGNGTRVFCACSSEGAELVGLTITGGSADWCGGGGILNTGKLLLSKSTVTGNSAVEAEGSGGGIYTTGALTVDRSVFSNNAAYYGGGGICNDDLATMSVSDSIFSGNRAHRGGALSSMYDATSTIANSTFSGNVTDGYAGAIENRGPMTIDRSIFSGNSCIDEGGAIWNFEHTPLTIMDSVLSGNVAEYGGAIKSSGTLVVADTNLHLNSAWHSGGAIYSIAGTITILDSTISGNVAETGGGLAVGSTTTLIDSTVCGNSANGATSRGGGIFTYSSVLTVEDSTVSGNAAGEGGGIYKYSGTLVSANSIVALNSAPSNPDVYGALGPGSGFNLIGGDPKFVRNPSPGLDGIWGTPDDDYGDLRLRSDSPAVDAGSNALLPPDSQDLDGDGNRSEPLPVDLAGNPRVIYGTVDIGAYEYWLLGDVNQDRNVGAADLEIVRANWGQHVTPHDWSHGDVSGDGLVGAADLDIVRAHWGQSVPPPAPLAVSSAVQPPATGVQNTAATTLVGKTTVQIQQPNMPLARAHDAVIAKCGPAGDFDRVAALAQAAWWYDPQQLRTRRPSRDVSASRVAVLTSAAYWDPDR